MITWRISARAEIFSPARGLKFCSDYMTGWNISLGAKYEIAREESKHNQKWRRKRMSKLTFSARVEIQFSLHGNFSDFSAGLHIFPVPGKDFQPWLIPSPCNRQFDFKRICFRSRAKTSAQLIGLKSQPGLKFAMWIALICPVNILTICFSVYWMGRAIVKMRLLNRVAYIHVTIWKYVFRKRNSYQALLDLQHSANMTIFELTCRLWIYKYNTLHVHMGVSQKGGNCNLGVYYLWCSITYLSMFFAILHWRAWT